MIARPAPNDAPVLLVSPLILHFDPLIYSDRMEMMFKKLILVGLLAMSVVVTSAWANKLGNLSGTWILDGKATESHIKGSLRPLNSHTLAQWFGLTSGYMCVMAYKFEGNAAYISAYRGKTIEYQFLSSQGGKIEYTKKNATGAAGDTLSVYMLNEENIKIVHSGNKEMGYLLWKRGQQKIELNKPSDLKTMLEACWSTSLQNIVEFLSEPPN
ncbi:MAG: hypothetical protein R8M11_06305 [Gallionella sp.]